MPLLLVNSSAVGEFCCSEGLDPDTSECIIPTLGSNEPFALDPGQIIMDRSNGNTAAGGGSPVTVTVTASAQSDLSNANTATGDVSSTTGVGATGSPGLPTTYNADVQSSGSGNSGKNNTVTIAVGVAVPLSVLLLLALIAIFLLWRRGNRKDGGQTLNGSETRESTARPTLMIPPRPQRETYEIANSGIYEASPEAQAYELRSKLNDVEVVRMHHIEADGTPIHQHHRALY